MSTEAKSLKKCYLQCCKSLKTEPLSSIKTACLKLVSGSLDLSSVYLDNEQASCVGETLSKCNGVCSELVLTDCLIKDKGLSTLSCGLKAVSKLILKGNELMECGYDLGSFLKVNHTITYLNLEWNMIGSSETSLAALCEGVAVNTSLVYLNLSNNQISHCGASFIASALATNEILKELDLSWNNIGVLGGRQLLTSIKLNTCLEELHLTGNNLTNDLLEAIGTTLSVKSRHYHDKKEWNTHRKFLQSEKEEKERESEVKVTCLYDQLDEMRMSSMGIAEKASEDILMYKAEIESCYVKITYMEDQLLTAKSALELVESQYSTVQEDYQLLVQETNDKVATLNSLLEKKDEEIESLKQDVLMLKEQKKCTEHDLQQKIKLLHIDKESANDMIRGLKEELSKEKESKANKMKLFEKEINDQSKTNGEQLQKVKTSLQLELSQNQSLWDKEKTLLTSQLQTASKRYQDLKQEYDELESQLSTDRAKSTQTIDQVKTELQLKHSSEILELNQQLKDTRIQYEASKMELNESKLKLSATKSERDSIEDQMKQLNTRYNQAIRTNDEQQTKILSVLNKHSQESEQLRQQRNQFEQLYEEHKQLLQKAKEKIQVLQDEQERQTNEANKEKSKLQQALHDSKQQLQLLKEHEAEKAKHLRNALETYLL